MHDQTEVAQSITVRVVREDSAGKSPFLVIQHGRPPDERGRKAMGLQSYPANSRYCASLGFVVLIPTRVGYGVSHGPDVEYTGECESKRFADGVLPAVAETKQLIEFVGRQLYIDARRGLVVGESFGGLVAVAAAANEIPGLMGSVNISGGDGGDSLHHVDQPCRPDLLQDTFARYGKGNRVPTLWMYSANDRVWGATYPRQWYAAFVDAGGRGSFADLPSDKNNGHYIFNRNAPAWHPAFEAFVKRLGLALPAR